MCETLNSGLPWLNDLVNSHFRATTREQRKRELDEAERNTPPELEEAFAGAPEDFENLPEDSNE